MSALLSLPRKLRDQILEDLARLSVDPPKDNAALHAQERMAIPGSDTSAWYGTEKIHFENHPTHAKSLRPLMLVNHQLRAETEELLRRSPAKPVSYVLDVLYCRNVHMYPTWLCVPVVSANVDTLYTQFRISNVPDAATWSFSGGDGGPECIVWPFYHLLRGILRFGPQGKRVGTQSGKKGRRKKNCYSTSAGQGITVKNLVIDFQPTAWPSVLPLAVYHRQGRDELNDYCRDRVPRDWNALSDNRLFTGDIMREWVIRYLEVLLVQCSYNVLPFATFFFGRLGSVAIRVDGTLKKRFDLGCLFSRLALWIHPNSSSYEARHALSWLWKEKAAEKRKAAGPMVTAAEGEEDAKD
ncbi:Uu.00g126320.m01.CDS01 [Anthostomella pinea]|uniref:Uu.00g126320.m01.CDS01 n=1 Tax=Anthostomella pinea TaxID=933095 RepID=A0AAI8VHZ1_9PEZI|nr:Uu.00g126320.m01.CDS01 [Anthostomella pinea]